MKILPLIALICLACPGLSGAGEKPNIIFIMADDLGYGDLGCYGQKLIQTPNIDRLADEGIRFTQAYSGGPVCTPSRSVLMTGLHGGHTPARDNVPHYPTYFEEGDITLAEVLKDSGYRTGGIGKWSLGDAGTSGAALNQGFDHWFGYLNQDHAHYYFTEYLDDNNGRRDYPDNALTREHYSHNLLTNDAVKFIRESKDTPFFYYAAYTLPHFSSLDEDPDGLAVPSTDPYSEKDWSEKAKKYAAMIHLLDRDVGRICDLVDELGLAEETLIIFTSDNGGHKNVDKAFQTSGPLRGFKRDLYEGGIRVPFIARQPGTIQPGSVSDEVIAFQDMMPTFGELAGAEVPENLDGLSITAALSGGKLEEKRPFLYWDFGHCRRYYDQAVRLGDWKGVKLGKEEGRLQLFDLATDSGETTDRAADHPEVVAQIEKIMSEAVTPNHRYPIGELYRGGPIWLSKNYHPSKSKLPPPATPGDPGYLSAEMIFPPDEAPTPSCHSSTIVETPAGLVASWFGGTSEPDIDNVIWVSRHLDGAWDEPTMVVDGTEGESRDHRVGNPVLFQPSDGPLMLFYKVVDPEVGKATHWWGMLTTSTDHGKTWSEPKRLGQSSKLGGGNPHLLGPVKNKPVELADGAIFCPSSSEHDGWRVHFEVTRDLGKTWEVIGPINDAKNYNVIQPSLLTYPDGRFQILCRSKEGLIGQSWSEDGGKTWGDFTSTSLPNPNSGTDAVTLSDGRQLLVYNHTIRKGPFPANRSMLNVAISNHGKQWNPLLTLEREDGEFSYPAVIQTSDGKVHITYTWKRESIKHVVLDPSALTSPRKP
ncbi:MAG: exo-alpha-sialidase [Verrucomicrobiales bacterium]|nr:exo-alpha-sialidase [Verrucomicrobiales bacterium]